MVYYNNKEGEEIKVFKGDIIMVEVKRDPDNEADSTVCSETRKRPAVVIQNNMGNTHSPITIVAYGTSKPKPDLPTHVSNVYINNKSTTFMCEQLATINKYQIISKIRSMTDTEYKRLNSALVNSLDLGCAAHNITLEEMVESAISDKEVVEASKYIQISIDKINDIIAVKEMMDGDISISVSTKNRTKATMEDSELTSKLHTHLMGLLEEEFKRKKEELLETININNDIKEEG
jgi:mRNA interferase MazF